MLFEKKKREGEGEIIILTRLNGNGKVLFRRDGNLLWNPEEGDDG